MHSLTHQRCEAVVEASFLPNKCAFLRFLLPRSSSLFLRIKSYFLVFFWGPPESHLSRAIFTPCPGPSFTIGCMLQFTQPLSSSTRSRTWFGVVYGHLTMKATQSSGEVGRGQPPGYRLQHLIFCTQRRIHGYPLSLVPFPRSRPLQVIMALWRS
jgi:hypothetical protein